MKALQEKRYFRRSYDNVSVAFCVVKAPTSNKPLSEPFTATVRDLSEQGMGIFTERELVIGQNIRFLWWVKGNNKIPDHGIVVWTMATDEGFWAGIFFSE